MRIKKHSSEPWRLGDMAASPDERCWDGTIWAPPDGSPEDGDPEPYEIGTVADEADAVRIVACVNALAGVPTNDLLRLEAGAFAESHAALLAACRMLMDYTGMSDATTEDDAEAEGESFARIWRAARAAIAKAKGDPTT